uniref:PiggyBac transposable element-derived protein domain-containing protein n=1 Tax=Erpetoichthys calabaricus TaxID=27687 RepID=A0A8C4RLY1_ERPCA
HFSTRQRPEAHSKMDHTLAEGEKSECPGVTSQSPDLNHSENLWKDLKIADHQRSPSNVTEEEWGADIEWAQSRSRSSFPVKASHPARSTGPVQMSIHLSTTSQSRKATKQTLCVPCQPEEVWHCISDEDDHVPPRLDFVPKRPPGPQLIVSQSYSPLQLFQLFFSCNSVTTIVENTNKFACERSGMGKKYKWTLLSVPEFFGYIALVIYMGLFKASNLTNYWSIKRGYNFSFPSSVMSRDRFLAISWSLHLCDPSDDKKNQQKKGTDGFDCLFKVKHLHDELVSSCKSFYQPDRHLSIDERMVATKARIGLKQYVKNKAAKWGYKLFVLADSISGYTWNFFIYQEEKMLSDSGLSHQSVMSLMEFSRLGMAYKLYVDKFYTSPALFQDLLEKHTGACGTIWKDGLLFVKWMDSREVSMCSSIHKAFSGATVKRRVKDHEGVWSKRDIPVPDTVLDYNKHMGGVDLSDALLGYYNHFVDIAVVNAFILHKELLKSQNKPPLTQKAFRQQLMVELSDAAKPPVPDQPRQGSFMPAYFGQEAKQSRRKCVICHGKTPVYCTKCDVALCFVVHVTQSGKNNVDLPPPR